MPTNISMDYCPDCGASVPPESRFCSQCGTHLVADETLEQLAETVIPDAASAPPPDPAEFPATLHQTHRRPLGIHPVTLLGGLGGLAILVAIILLAAGAVIDGFILLGLAIALLALFSVGVRREPHSGTARAFRRGLEGLRSMASLAAVTVRAWAHAGVNLVRIRHRQRRLRRELHRHLAPLGEAVYQDDQQRAQELKRRAEQLDRELDEAQRTASSVIGGARRKIERERATFEPTESFPRPG